MKIKLKSIKLKNFKGIKDLTINFNKNTNIYGENATGKTTIFDAFTWVLFGKDSLGAKDFDLKTKDINGNFIPKIEHEVEAVLSVDETDITIKSILREKWTTRRGTAEAVFTGNETTYFFNDVPMKQEEYKKKINSIIDEKLFKLITNPLYFESLKWQERREILTNLVTAQSDSEIAAETKKFNILSDVLKSKSIDEYKRETAAKKKKLKNELEAIPTRIDEVMNGIPDEEDWEAINSEIKAKNEMLNKIQNQIYSIETPSEDEIKIKETISKIKSEMLEIKENAENEYHTKKQLLMNDIRQLENSIFETNSEIKLIDNKILSCQKEMKESEKYILKLRERISEINKTTFDENNTICPTCGRAYETSKIEEMKQHFEAGLKEEFEKINIRGKNLKSGIDELQLIIDKSDKKKSSMLEELNYLNSELSAKKAELKELIIPNMEENADYIAKKQEIKNLISEIDKPVGKTSLEADKKFIESKIKELKTKLLQKEQIEKSKERIKELEENQRELANKNAELDKIDFNISEFLRFKIDKLENEINSKFEFVKFKMFETQINGAETECCKTLFNGITNGNSLNTGASIKAGIDIINTLCRFYDVYAPIFIDNKESITENIVSDSQIINLIVSENDNILRVEEN